MWVRHIIKLIKNVQMKKVTLQLFFKRLIFKWFSLLHSLNIWWIPKTFIGIFNGNFLLRTQTFIHKSLKIPFYVNRTIQNFTISAFNGPFDLKKKSIQYPKKFMKLSAFQKVEKNLPQKRSFSYFSDSFSKVLIVITIFCCRIPFSFHP